MRARIEIEPTSDHLCNAAAGRILASARQAIAARGSFSIALSGGTTPRGAYRQLASPPLATAADWPLWQVFWGDERWVPPQDPQSNYHMACVTLLNHVPVDPARVHPMVPRGWASPAADRSQRVGRGGMGADSAEAASSYEGVLESELDVGGGEDSDASRAPTECRPPRLDLVLLGLGADGHTASLFPGAKAVEETRRWVVATPAPGGEGERDLPRLTLTLPVLNAAREVIFLVSGAAKSRVVAAVLTDNGVKVPKRRALPLPAARVVPAEGRLTWLLDEAAAADL